MAVLSPVFSKQTGCSHIEDPHWSRLKTTGKDLLWRVICHSTGAFLRCREVIQLQTAQSKQLIHCRSPQVSAKLTRFWTVQFYASVCYQKFDNWWVPFSLSIHYQCYMLTLLVLCWSLYYYSPNISAMYGTCCMVSRSQTLIVWSSLTVARWRRSGSRDSDSMRWVCVLMMVV